VQQCDVAFAVAYLGHGGGTNGVDDSLLGLVDPVDVKRRAVESVDFERLRVCPSCTRGCTT